MSVVLNSNGGIPAKPFSTAAMMRERNCRLCTNYRPPTPFAPNNEKVAACFVEFSDCDGNPCRNGGHCVASGKGFVCNCPVEYRGLYCEADARLFYDPLPAVSSSNTIQRVEMATLLGVMLCGLIASVLIIGCFIGVMCEKRKLPRGEGDEAANSFWTDAAKALVQKTEGSGDSSSKESTDDEDGARDPNKLRSILKNGRQRNDIGGGTVTKSVGSRDFWDIA
ncbi:hypothetical protein LSAT2_015127 [Lamellibrachia satsuma]|nr:hypothetical protein LSAT2_015127 [Lamellibrachia satsuma]